MWFLLYLVDSGILRSASLKFFQRSHTKSACDRGFSSVKKHLSKVSCWTLDALEQAVNDSATTSQSINLDSEAQPFWDFKAHLAQRYKRVQGV